MENEATGPGAKVRVGPFTARVTPAHFSAVPGEEDRKRLFASAVTTVVVELFSYCNRRCKFCPNTEGTRLRLKNQTILPEDTYRRLIASLAEIDYAQRIFFHLYNEPLALPEIMLPRMKHARAHLPKALFAFNTNGDYLTPGLLKELAESGCNQLAVSIYGPDHGRWDDDYIRDRVVELSADLGVEGPLVEKPGQMFAVSGTAEGISLFIRGVNLWETGYDRGGLVPELAVKRTSPCLAPFSEFLVDHRGYALPCCNVYTDRPEHLDYTLGNINDDDIFTIYAAAAAQRWRKGLLRFEPGGSLCGGCSRGDVPALDTAQNRSSLSEFYGQMCAAQ